MTEATASALTEYQAAYVSGLIELAGWLANNPDAIPPLDEEILLPLHTITAVQDFAARHGLEVVYDAPDDGMASVIVSYGPIRFRAYGYEDDFDTRTERVRRRVAERFAAEHGLALVPAEAGGRS